MTSKFHLPERDTESDPSAGASSLHDVHSRPSYPMQRAHIQVGMGSRTIRRRDIHPLPTFLTMRATWRINNIRYRDRKHSRGPLPSNLRGKDFFPAVDAEWKVQAGKKYTLDVIWAGSSSTVYDPESCSPGLELKRAALLFGAGR